MIDWSLGTTRSANTPDFALVNQAYIDARDGDTILIGNGSASWTQKLTITKSVRILGGTTVTGAGGPPSGVVCQDNTNILRNYNGSIFVVAIPTTGSCQISGITFREDVNGTGSNVGGIVHVGQQTDNSAPLTEVRIDHCHFANFKGGGLAAVSWSYGVCDHCFFEAVGNAQHFYCECATYADSNYGNGAYADFPYYGTEKFWFVETCTMVGAGNNSTNGASDAEKGARFVLRHNYYQNCRPGWHGTEGNNRGSRAAEVYLNTQNWTAPGVNPSCECRSGTTLYHDNTFFGTKNQLNQHMGLTANRQIGGSGPDSAFGMANGADLLDKNDTEGNYGTPAFVDGKPGFVHESGIVTSGSLTKGAPFTDSTKNWPTNHWEGFSVSSGPVGSTPSNISYPRCGIIRTNTNNKITYDTYVNPLDRDPPTQLFFNTGDPYTIYRLIQSLDQPGVGKGDLLAGGGTTPATNTRTPGQRSFARFQTEPCMSWNNFHSTGGGSPTITELKFGGINTDLTFTLNRDFYEFGLNNATTPATVISTYVAAKNGVNYTGPLPYPHRLAGGSPPAASIDSTSCEFLSNTAGQSNFTVQRSNFVGTVTFAAPTVTSVPSGATPNALPSIIHFSSGGVFSCDNGAAVAGPYQMTLSATSTGGQSATGTFTLTIKSPSVNKPPENVAVTKPANNSSFTAPATITLESSASDPDGTLASIKYYHGGSNLITTIDATVVSSPWTYDWTNVQVGTYQVTVKATDNSGDSTTSSPAVTVIVGGISLQGPTIVVSATRPSEPVATKKILHWQATNNNRINTVVSNKTYIDTLPFDGLVLSVPSYQSLVGIGDVVNYGSLTTGLTGEVHPIQGQLANVTHNYLDIMPGNTGMVDPFDSWTQTIANFVTVAKVCKEQGLEGIFFDNEEYNVHWWTYPGDVAHAGSHTEPAYQAEWRQRGKDAMAAMIAEWPAIKIVHTIGPNRSVDAAPFPGAFSGSSHWLGGYFFAGMFEQVPTGNHVISGGELYYLRTPTHFSTTKSFLDTIYTQNNALFSSSSVNPTWLANDDLSWGIYDQDSGDPPAVNGGVDMTAAILQTTIQNAVPNADEFVWNYSESGLEWLTPGGGSVGTWQDAVRAARANLGI